MPRIFVASSTGDISVTETRAARSLSTDDKAAGTTEYTATTEITSTELADIPDGGWMLNINLPVPARVFMILTVSARTTGAGANVEASFSINIDGVTAVEAEREFSGSSDLGSMCTQCLTPAPLPAGIHCFKVQGAKLSGTRQLNLEGGVLTAYTV